MVDSPITNTVGTSTFSIWRVETKGTWPRNSRGQLVVPRPGFVGCSRGAFQADLAARGDGGLPDIHDEGAGLKLAGVGVDLWAISRRNSALTVVSAAAAGLPRVTVIL